MLASTMSIAILATLNEVKIFLKRIHEICRLILNYQIKIIFQRPTMNELISWIDVDTLLLLFSMMILVAVIAETGIFDWLAVYAYKVI